MLDIDLTSFKQSFEKRVSPAFRIGVLIALILSFTAIAVAHIRIPDVMTKKGVVIDIRSWRGGFGDILSGLMFARYLRDELSFKGDIVLLANDPQNSTSQRSAENTKVLLERVNAFDPELMEGTSIQTIKELQLRVFGGYYSFARRTPDLPDDVRREGFRDSDRPHVTIASDGYLSVTTVFDNSENNKYSKGSAYLFHENRVFLQSGAGLGKEFGGIYSSRLSRSLRKLSLEQVRRKISQELAKFSQRSSDARVHLLRDLFGNLMDQGIPVGFAYGISKDVTAKQYVQFLNELASINETLKVIITPSRFPVAVESSLAPNVEVIRNLTINADQLNFKKNQILVLETPNLPNQLFQLCMRLSAHNQIVTAVAGDVAVSHAIEMGIPFMMPTLAWNHSTARGLLDRLAKIASDLGHPIPKDLIQKLTPGKTIVVSDLSGATSLMDYDESFRQLNTAVPSIFRRMMENISAVDQGKTSIKSSAHVEDPHFRQELEKGGLEANEFDLRMISTDRSLLRQGKPGFYEQLLKATSHLAGFEDLTMEQIPVELNSLFREHKIEGDVPTFIGWGNERTARTSYNVYSDQVNRKSILHQAVPVTQKQIELFQIISEADSDDEIRLLARAKVQAAQKKTWAIPGYSTTEIWYVKNNLLDHLMPSHLMDLQTVLDELRLIEVIEPDKRVRDSAQEAIKRFHGYGGGVQSCIELFAS